MKTFTLRNTLLTVTASAMLVSAPLSAQVPLDRGIAGTALALRQMEGVKRVLLIGAHPDDEDTALLTALARGMGAETAYLSLTRGDGGQNLIGPQLGEGLGVVRTGELLAARELDGGGQYFTRAFDYGYSKNADEAFSKWPREELLRDVVHVIRTFRPQVIVAQFTGTPADGHGQHQASGIMAIEAFTAAADPTLYPELTANGAGPWQAAKLYQRRRGDSQTGTPTTVTTGTYDAVLGRSYFQVAMDSRSQHRSQDMGASQPFGARASSLVLVQSAPMIIPDSEDFFSGVDTTLVGALQDLPSESREQAAAHIAPFRTALNEARSVLTPLDPSAAVRPIATALQHLRMARQIAETADPEAYATGVLIEREARMSRMLINASDVQIRVRVSDDLVVPGDDMEVVVELWNGGQTTLTDAMPALSTNWRAQLTETTGTDLLAGPGFAQTGMRDAVGGGTIAPGDVAQWTYRVEVPEDADLSRLYFREAPRDGEMYVWPESHDEWAQPISDQPFLGQVQFNIEQAGVSTPVLTTQPPRFVSVDKAVGEFDKPVLIVPAVSVKTSPESLVFPQGATGARQVSIEVTSEDMDGTAGTVSLVAPSGWSISPAEYRFEFEDPGQSRSFSFDVLPAASAVGRTQLTGRVLLNDGRTFSEAVTLIDYPHIDRTAMIDPAVVGVTVVPVAVTDARIGYVMGSGDDGLLALQQMGANAELVTVDQFRTGDLSGYDVLVLGIRVYETRPDVAAVNDQILDFARAGGTVVVQYNKYEYPQGGFAPYAVQMGRPNSRTTDENSPVEFLNPASPVFNSPNQIGMEDFDGWVQERGLYFLTEWESPFEPVIAFTDPGEDPQNGSIVIAPVGEGLYVYTGISFFRQFPAGVAGAYRLFANLVSLRAGDVTR